MAFDYGSIDLGIRNPFIPEGRAIVARAVLQLLLAAVLLFMAVSTVREDGLRGWLLLIGGFLLLASSLRALTTGINALLRYFVGRNHPSSLARNYDKSQSSTAADERHFVAYTDDQLEEMMMGRKNITFVEPVGILSRFLHSLVPNLLFMPYPMRNLAQNLFGAWVSTAVMLIAYALTAFISLAGFAGEAGERAFPVYSMLLLVYLLWVWYRASAAVTRQAVRGLDTSGNVSLLRTIGWSLLLPFLTGAGLEFVLAKANISLEAYDAFMAGMPSLQPGWFIVALLMLAGLATFLIVTLLKYRLTHCNPAVEVSELRENWQESIHPNEIFINLDNLVMANRRYKEVPNRVYRELLPQLNEQAAGKGDFFGEMLQEVQPRVHELDMGPGFRLARKIALFAGQGFFLLASVLFAWLVFRSIDFAGVLRAQQLTFQESLPQMMGEIRIAVAIVISWIIARLLANAAHLFFAEIQFESLLVYFKCEGTFTESKISTGTGIHDSTRSENTLVRSSITPWAIASRIISTTIAATGMRNLEYPRYILEMYRADEEMAAIRKDIMHFFKDRESIAAITSERDLGNASQIYQLNQQTRARLDPRLSDAEAAGYIADQERDEGNPR